MSDYDVIVIGAGNGGLTAAAMLAQNGLKVLILERHNIPGGSATTFCRGRFEFEVALHQLSGLGTAEQPGPLRSLLGKLKVLEDLSFVEMTDLYRVVIPGKLDLTLPTDRAGVITTLQSRFPREKEAISKFFDLIYSYAIELYSFFRESNPSSGQFPTLKRYAFKNAKEVLDQFFTDPLLKAVLGSYWSFIGLTPDRLPFSYLAICFFGYIEMKPCHIKGGSQSLSNAILNRFLSWGGEARFNCGVKKILVEKGSVKGVVTEQGDEIKSKFVVSNASKISTFVELLDPEYIPHEMLLDMRGRTTSPSGFCLYMGLDCEPGEVGINAATNFILPDEDISGKHFNGIKTLDTKNNAVAFSCYDVADPEFSPPGTCQISLVTLKYAEPWLRLPPTQYAREKYRCAEAMILQMEKICPNVRAHIEEVEVATPLTFMRYLGTPEGSVYGFEQYMEDTLFFQAPRISSINGLFMAGGWVTDCGFEPTLKSGTSAAGTILRQLK